MKHLGTRTLEAERIVLRIFITWTSKPGPRKPRTYWLRTIGAKAL